VESFERIDELQRNSGGLRGVPTGFQDLDNLLAGMQKSNLLILAARPGMGKTAFALNIAHHAAVQAKLRIGVFSLEMSREELVDRLLVSQADIDAWRLKTGRLDQQDFLKLSDAMGVLADAKIFIDDSPGLSIFEMRTRARRIMTEHHIDLLLVDYLQLAHGRTTDNRVQEVAEISQGLKNIARELKIPVLALSQLSRAVESRGERIPQLSDLRESGSIEQDADVVMFLYRKDDDVREAVNLKIAKHRNGALGDIDLYFKGDRIKFYGMETKRMNV
jgi:replicative DNA helicase